LSLRPLRPIGEEMLDSQPDGWNGAEGEVGCNTSGPITLKCYNCRDAYNEGPGAWCCEKPTLIWPTNKASAPPRTILDDAARLTSNDRQKVYGHPRANFGQTAELWSAILGAKVTAEQVALCMIAAKISRLCKTPDHRDSWVDIAGYARTGEMLSEVD
jgi:hypothetical protein